MTEYVYHNGIAYAKTQDVKQEEKSEKKKINFKHDRSFTLLQTAVCVFILILFIILKLIGGETYEKVRSYYKERMYSSVIAKEDDELIDEKIGELLDYTKK